MVGEGRAWGDRERDVTEKRREGGEGKGKRERGKETERENIHRQAITGVISIYKSKIPKITP